MQQVSFIDWLAGWLADGLLACLLDRLIDPVEGFIVNF